MNILKINKWEECSIMVLKGRMSWKKDRVLHIWLLIAVGVILLFQLIKQNRGVVNFITSKITAPVKEIVADVCAFVPFSVAEVLICMLSFMAFVVLGLMIFGVIRSKEKLGDTLRYLEIIAAIAITIYAGFCVLWGLNYYTDNFQEMSGIYAAPLSVEQLEKTTAYFAQMLNNTADLVDRTEAGIYAQSEEGVFLQCKNLYDGIEQKFPFLKGGAAVVKPVFLSELMSYTDFTGVYFPFTGESNVNVHCPQCMLPSTIAHEIAHQRGVAMEQEANFVAVLACSESGIPAYEYSGYLLGYIHLGNALYDADKDKWKAINDTVSTYVKVDLIEHAKYWVKYDTPVKSVTTGIYEGFLQSYGQKMGMKSYGAVVDLLVAYFEG